MGQFLYNIPSSRKADMVSAVIASAIASAFFLIKSLLTRRLLLFFRHLFPRSYQCTTTSARLHDCTKELLSDTLTSGTKTKLKNQASSSFVRTSAADGGGRARGTSTTSDSLALYASPPRTPTLFKFTNLSNSIL